jgi:drug/metabolite transporter (DMT)-like permease
MVGINPLTFTTTKNFTVGLLLFSFLIFSKKILLIKSLSLSQISKLVLIGVIGGSLPFYLFFTGLAQTSAVNAAILQKTLVLWVALLAVPFLKEKLSPFQIVGVILLFASNLVVGGFKGFSFNFGEQMILVATILWAVETVIAKKALKTVDVDLVTGARMGLGSLVLVFLGGLQPVTSSQFVSIGVTAVMLLAYVSVWYRALKYAPAVVVTSILVLATLVTNLLSSSINLSQISLMMLGAGLLLSKLLWSKTRDFFAPAKLKL